MIFLLNTLGVLVVALLAAFVVEHIYLSLTKAKRPPRPIHSTCHLWSDGSYCFDGQVLQEPWLSRQEDPIQFPIVWDKTMDNITLTQHVWAHVPRRKAR